MTEPIIRPSISEFEQQLLERLDKMIDKQDDIIKAVWASHGVDIEYQSYTKKYEEIKMRAKNPELKKYSLDELGIEVTDA